MGDQTCICGSAVNYSALLMVASLQFLLGLPNLKV